MHSLIIALVISGATALSVRSPRHTYSLLRRQAGNGLDPQDIPTQCQTTCAPILNELQTCTTDACLCTTTVKNDFDTCLNCFLSINPGDPSVQAAVQNATTEFQDACNGNGNSAAPFSATGAGFGSSGFAGPSGGISGGASSGFNSATFPSGTAAGGASSPLFTPSATSGAGAGAGTSVGGGAGATQTLATPAGTAAGSSSSSSSNPAAGIGGGKSAGNRQSANVGLSVVAVVLGVAALGVW